MTSDSQQIRAEVAARLADMPDPEGAGADLDVVAAQLDDTHELLVRALRSAERTTAGGSPPDPGIDG